MRLQRLDVVHPEDKQVKTLYPPNLPAYHGIEDCAAYNPLPASRQEQFWLCIEPDEPEEAHKASVVFPGAGVSWLRRERSLAHPLLDVYGVRYLLTNGVVKGGNVVGHLPPVSLVELPVGWATPGGPFHLYERTSCLPRATFVRRIAIVPDLHARLALLSTMEHDARRTVVLEDPDAPHPTDGEAPPATVDVRERRDERVLIHVECAADGYLRLADPYDAGWRALVDGAPTKVYAADHHLRAVYLSPGSHEVVFTYDAPAVVWPARLSILALLATLVLWFWPRRKPA
jgi:hypothetical protein